MAQWIIELLYPIAVFLCVITGLMLLGTAWFLFRYDLRDKVRDIIDTGNRLVYWVLDIIFGYKGGTE